MKSPSLLTNLHIVSNTRPDHFGSFGHNTISSSSHISFVPPGLLVMRLRLAALLETQSIATIALMARGRF